MISQMALGHSLVRKCIEKIELMPWVPACFWPANLGRCCMDSGDPFSVIGLMGTGAQRSYPKKHAMSLKEVIPP